MATGGTENIEKIALRLKRAYLDYPHNNKKNPLDELLFIICSVQTTRSSYEDVYRKFRREFPSFESIERASIEDLSRSLYTGGLYFQRAAAINEIMGRLSFDFGKPTLKELSKMDDKDAEAYLTSLPRVGKKVARCVLMYSLDRKVFPVDTHCWRISRRVGWVRATGKDGKCTGRDMDRLQEKIPPDLRFSLHVNFVSHGREICVYGIPKCEICQISRFCRKIGA